MNAPEPPPDSVSPRPSVERLRLWEKLGLSAFAVALVAFGGLVLLRSAFQESRKTDAGVYFRAADAVLKGKDLYALTVCDDNGWHYCYPPAFAVLMVPFADPFIFEERGVRLPYALSIALWYALSVLLAGYAVHTFASAALPEESRGSRRWWYARTVPIYVCLGGLGYTLSRGQVNILLLALLAGLFAADRRGRRFRAGLWMAAAVALKVIPIYLAMIPLLRRDGRHLLGGTVGLALFLGALPAAVFGLSSMVEHNLVFVDAVLAPGAIGTGDQTRAKELTNTKATDSQSFQAILHNIRHPVYAERPANAAADLKLAHVGIVAVLTLVNLAVGLLRPPRDPRSALIFLGCLTVTMLHATPVSHVHYYALALPLICGLWCRGLHGRPDRVIAAPHLILPLSVWAATIVAILLPYEFTVKLRDNGLGVVATMALWAFGLAAVASDGRRANTAQNSDPIQVLPSQPVRSSGEAG